jgi:diguanylate cyclase (GGDEF)-like protein
LTASIGIACFPEHGETVELLLENVDKALYRAKEKGKNRIEVFS